jgi:CBS domain-containing protein
MTEDAFSFLSKVHPYSSLPRETLGEVSRQVGLQHLLAGEVIVLGEEGTRQALYVVRQGAVQVATDAFVIDTLLPGESFGYESSSSSSLPDGCRATATRDSLLLVLEGSLFQTFLAGSTVEEHLREKSDSFRKRVQEIRQLQRSTRIDPFLRLSLKDVEHSPPVVIGAGTTVAAAVGEMVRRDATSCLVAGDAEMSGIITERDILAKVVARELDPKAVRVESIMSAPLITVRSESLLFEAFSTMVRSSIRKLVVVDRQGRPEGIIEERDLLSVKGENPVHLAAEIASAASTKVLASVFERVNQMAVRSVAEGIGIFPVGRLISDMHDQLLIRICDLVLAGLGEEPPTGFSFLALGSEGRREQYLATDQDNGLVYSDHELAGPFFERFATSFSTALLEVGMPPCPHEVMISNPKWRRSLGGWLEEIDKLIRKADLDSILRISLLMDMRHVAGDGELAGKMKSFLLKRVSRNTFLLKYMARESLRFTPPIGFFNNFVLEKSGERKGEMDIKRGGVFPVTQGVRTLAAEYSLLETSTEERINRLGEAGVFSAGLAAGLREAYEFFQTLRVRSQAERIGAGEKPDNYISPDSLSSMERDRLKECFKVVIDFQSLIFNKYGLRLLI